MLLILKVRVGFFYIGGESGLLLIFEVRVARF